MNDLHRAIDKARREVNYAKKLARRYPTLRAVKEVQVQTYLDAALAWLDDAEKLLPERKLCPIHLVTDCGCSEKLK